MSFCCFTQRCARDDAATKEELVERVRGLEGERDLLAEGLVQVRVCVSELTPYLSSERAT